MGLSSILLSGQNAIDKDLDQLFTTKPPASTKTATPIAKPGSSKGIGKKRKAAPEVPKAEKDSKRSKSSTTDSDHVDKPKQGASANRKEAKISSGKGKEKEIEVTAEEKPASKQKSDITGKEVEHEEQGDDENAPPILHESLRKGGEKAHRSTSTKIKYVSPDETSVLRDERTIFVGNLPVEVAQKRPLLKQLQRHILSQVPSAKIESTRFRSVPFQAPTSKLPDETADARKPKSTRAHDINRSSAWRSSHTDSHEKEGTGNEQDKKLDMPESDNRKKYLTPNHKKKIAFINHDFHSTADTVNAYIVFAHPVPPESRPANLPPPPEVMDPYKAAKQAARICDGSVFMDRVIRVDVVVKNVRGIDVKGKGSSKKDVEGGAGVDRSELPAVGTDPKSSVFVGNLDFESSEEDLRAFFETVIREERGEPPADDDEEISRDATIEKPNSWVFRVRIIRDKDTQLGKGFAYVQFVDRQCVDEVLAMERGKLKFAKRKLRVQRCRTLPGVAPSTQRDAKAPKEGHKGKEGNNQGKTTKPPVQSATAIPKGDPSLGEKLAHLSKEERRRYKSADQDRVARRLAKKKARMTMAGGSGGVKVLGKERERERVRKSAGKKGVQSTVKKRRVRSEKSLAKRNGKKAQGGAE